MKHSLKSIFTKRNENKSPEDNTDLHGNKSAIICEICGTYFQMRNTTIITTALLTAYCCCLQITEIAAQTKFQVAINGTGFGAASQQTSDGGYIIGSYVYDAATDNNMLLTKIDANSNLQWSKSFGGASDDRGFSVQQTDDNSDGQKDDGYIIAGWTWSFGDVTQFYVVKTDANGNMTWSKTFGGSTLKNDRGASIIQTNDYGYAIVGYTESFGAGGIDILLIKMDNTGNLSWSRTFGWAGSDFVFDEAEPSIQQCSDGGYIIAGSTNSAGAGNYDALLIKTDGNGNLSWSRTFGGAGDDRGNSVQQTTDGGYILTGSTASFGAGSNDVYLIKTNGSGNLLWSRTFGGTGSDNGYSIQQTTDGGYAISGSTSSFGAGLNDVYLVRTDSNGDYLWSKKYSNGGFSNEIGACLSQTSDGGYFISGLGGGGIYLIKTD